MSKFPEGHSNVTNPYILASVVSASNIVQPSPEEVKPSPFDLIGKILGIFGLLYAIGFVSLNLIYYFWGFHDFNLSHQQCIYAGIWAMLFFGLSCFIATGIWEWGKRFLHTKLCFQRWRCVCFAAYCIALLLLFWLHSSVAPLAKTHDQSIMFALLAVIAGSTGFVLLISLPSAGSLFNFKVRQANRIQTPFAITGAIVITALMLFLFSAFYAEIPLSWGGARPEKRSLWISNEAVPFLSHYNFPPEAKKQPTGDGITLYSGLWVLHESRDTLTLWTEKSGILQIPRQWVKAKQWDNGH